MERRFELRKEALLAECEVSPWVFRGAIERLERFIEPFADLLVRKEQQEHALTFLSGLVSDLDRKNTEAIAYRDDQQRKELQHFIGESNWDDRRLRMELARQVGQQIGCVEGVIVFDPSAFPKKGSESVGVKRQWCGRLGKTDNCQVGIYMGYISSQERALVDVRLYLPKEWAKDRKRRKKCKIPKEARFKTRHKLALEMLDEKGHLLPHAWVTGDDEMGRSTAFRRELHSRNEQYVLAVPCNTLVRDLQAEPPAYGGRGAKPKTSFVRVDAWCRALPKAAWTRIEVRDAEKGPLVVDVVKCRVQAKTDRRRVGPEEMLVVMRSRDERGKLKHDYHLSNASAETELDEFARAAKAENRIEECIKRGKSQAGLADYQVRNWPGWHHHQTLSLITAWFLILETRRGKKMDTSYDGSTDSRRHRAVAPFCLRVRSPHTHRSRTHPKTPTHPTRPPLPLETPQQVTTIEHRKETDLEQ